MTSPGPCPVCGGRRAHPPRSLPGLTIVACRACGHREALHDAPEDEGRDYHAQYDEGAFLEALRATRVRQAGVLIGLLRRHVRDLSRVVDYGAGRGWFLEACRAAGVAPVAGVDTSALAVEGLRASGIEAHLLSEPDGAGALAPLSFRPRVLCLLDVLEHFPPDRLEARVRGIVSACGEDLELVVAKVPVAGLLYAGANALSHVGVVGPLLQLYQAGTWPPHFNYFSPASAERLFASAGLSVVERVGDPDFEPRLFGERIGAKRPVARALARVAGEAIGATIRVTRLFDAAIFLARPRRTPSA